MKTFQCDQMQVKIFETNDEMGMTAARDIAAIIRAAVAERGQAALIMATGNSQLSVYRGLQSMPDVPWDRVSIFHMDEYLGMNQEHPASFRRYMREKFADIVHPRAFYGVPGDARDVDAAIAEYAALLEAHDPVACVLGIGENGHLAFNDPPADFDDRRAIKIVRLAETARRQQVGEGHFPTIADVPEFAITLTIPTLLRPAHVLAVVPESRKAAMVKASLEGPVTPDCPGSVLRTLKHARLYLDGDSAALLSNG
jgi:glucosamine-6-phosphate deaminase